MLSYSLCTICTSSKKLPVSIQTSFLALSSLNPSLTHPYPPPKKTYIHTRYIYLLCDDMQNKNSFTFLSRFTWFRLAGLAFSLGLCFVTIALIFQRIKNLIIYHFFLNYYKIPNCLSLQWRICLIEFFLDSHH